jgi:hypothetical protein
MLEPVYSSAIPLWGREVILAHHALAPEYHAVASELRGQVAICRDVGIVHFSREWNDWPLKRLRPSGFHLPTRGPPSRVGGRESLA